MLWIKPWTATHQKETDILANTESLWDQISKYNVCKESNNHVESKNFTRSNDN